MDITNCKIAIIGLGYVGFPLAKSFSRYFETIGYDINDNLIDFGCSVDIYDPLLKNDNILTKNPFNLTKKYDAIILAVSHRDFYNYTLDDFNKISKEKLVLLDLKNVYKFATWKF